MPTTIPEFFVRKAQKSHSPPRASSVPRNSCARCLSIYLSKDSPHPLAAGAEVRAVYLVTPGVAVIDLNSAFANGHRSGVLEEELTVTSLIQTLVANIPDILRVKILVDGKDRETLAGHADLSDFYDTGAVALLASQLQGGQ